MNQQLADYVASHRQQGFSDTVIRQELTNAGWPAQDIDVALGSFPPRALKNFSEILDAAVELYRHRFWTIIALYLVAIVGALVVVGSILLPPLLGLPLTSVPGIIIMLVGIAVCIAAALPIGQAIYLNLKSDTNIGWKASYMGAWRYVWPAIWTGLLAGLVTLSGFVLIIPGIMMLVWFCVSGLIVVQEDMGGLAALAQSRAYTKGRWWATAWRLALLPILIWAVQLLSSFFAPAIANTILRIAVTIVQATFFPVYYYVLYKELKRTYISEDKPVRTRPFAILAWLGVVIIAVIIAGVGYFLAWRASLFSSPSSNSAIQQEVSPTPLPHYTLDLTGVNNIPNGPTLGNYIVENLNNGVSPDGIRAALLKAGWKPQYIDQAFKAVHQD